jgi:hypothetical protein
VDLDNTLICYDRVFVEAAGSKGLVEPGFTGGKQAVRSLIWELPEGDNLWQQIQGEVYSKRIWSAELYDGADAFLRRCQLEGAPVWIVSHKTQFNSFDPDQVDLRETALGWLQAKGLFGEGLGLSPDRVYFETTRQDKVTRLGSLGCTHVIDDLLEVFNEPSFPPGVRKLLFDPSSGTGRGTWASWPEIEQEIFGPVQSGMRETGEADGGRR